MPLSAPAPPNKRKKANKIIIDFTNITQDDEQSDPEASELDLGTKIKAPKDTMLEELSLMSNKGSKMFKMRQQRVERFIVTNENTNLQNLAPSLGCEMMASTAEPESEHVEEEVLHEEQDKEKRRKQYVRTYVSPWERAMKGDESLTATMHGSMPGPHAPSDLPKFKSFNRTALPYGGSEKVGQMTFEHSDILLSPVEAEPLPSLQPDIRSRPSFNRTPIGWVCNLEDNSHIRMELDNMLPFDGETDDL
ncbi:myozenin-1b isoform X2 [Esox lucius]|uniref:Myozenin-1-like n=1 Tax=Esox lucius TaxID=8010 RepID=A0A3P8X8W4_ESOLU|nr:myozenin-1b isoform X2 [Esox lucius]